MLWQDPRILFRAIPYRASKGRGVTTLQPTNGRTLLSERAAHGRAIGLVALATLAAAAFGALLPNYPLEAVAVVCLVPLALAYPVISLGAILFLTVLVPFDLQNQLSIGGGGGVPGLLVADLLLIVGLCRVAVLAFLGRLQAPNSLWIAFALVGAIAAALVYGVASGASASDAGFEARSAAFGVGGFILALPLLENATDRRRLYWVLLALGIALGLWGIGQWIFDVHYGAGGDVGVRPGIDQIASAGGGQLQGGLYAFPVAAILSFALLLSRQGRSTNLFAPAALVFGLNCVCVLLTYERTMWGAALIGCLIVTVRYGRQSLYAAGSLLAIGVVGLVLLTVISPALPSASGRIASVASYQSDNSLQARKVESNAVIHAIRGHPLTGSGFGATITWGEKDVFQTTTTNFSHNGYLWLAWKVGLPLALLFVAAIVAVALRARRHRDDSDIDPLRIGSQAALFALLVVCVTFPAFNALGITAVMGVMAAACLARAQPSGGRLNRTAASRWAMPPRVAASSG
jgi:hypothetical protein